MLDLHLMKVLRPKIYSKKFLWLKNFHEFHKNFYGLKIFMNFTKIFMA